MRKKLNYIDFFTKNIDVYECPFFLLWLEEQHLEIIKSTLKVRRKGLPKSGTHPMVRNKQLLALAKTLKKFKLKDFAEEFGTSYGVVRVWNREKAVEEKAEDFRFLFAAEYVRKLEELSSSIILDKYGSESYQDSQAENINLFYEARHYQVSIQTLIMDIIEYRIETDDKTSGWDMTLSTFVNAINEWNIFNPPKDRKIKAEFEQSIALSSKRRAKFFVRYFDLIKESIENGDFESAINSIDFLSPTISDLINDMGVLGLSVINKGKRRVSKDLEKLYKAAQKTIKEINVS